MHRVSFPLRWAGSLFISMGIAVNVALAACPEGNLVPDYDLEDFASVWRGADRLRYRKGVVNQFEGMPEFFHFVTAEESFPKGIVSPEMRLETNTWYQGEVVFRLPEGIADAAPISLAFRLRNGREYGRQTATRTSSGFRRLRAFFNSGDETRARLVLRTGVPGVSFGRMTVVPVAKESDRRPVLLDPVNGRFNIAGGKQSRVFCGQPFLLAEGEGVRASVKVRVTKPLKRIRFSVLDELGIYGREMESIEDDMVGNWVTLVIDRRLPERYELHKLLHLKNTKTLYDSLLLARPSFVIEGAEDASVEFKDIQLMVLPREDRPANTSKNKVAWNPSFESGYWGWSVRFFRYPAPGDRLSFMELDETTAAEGRSSLKVVCENETRNRNKRFVRIQQNIMRPAPQRNYTVSFWAKADRPTTLTVDYDHVAKRRFNLGTGWRRYSMSGLMKRIGAWEYNELKFTANLDGETFWLDGVQVEEGTAASAFESPEGFEVNCELPPAQFKIYYPEENRAATVRCRASASALEGAKLRVVIEDYRGRPVKTVYENTVSVEKGGTFAETFELNPDAYGWFHIHSLLEDSTGRLLAEGWSAMAVVVKSEKVPLSDSYCGMMVAPTHIERNGGRETYQITNGFTMDDEFNAYAKTGARWIRLHTPGDWWAHENNPGEHSFEQEDYLVDTAGRHNIGILVDFLCHRPPDWSLPGGKFVKGQNLKPEIPHVVRFAEAWSRHFAGRVGALQFQNETGGYEARDFYENCRAVTPIFRRNMPDTILMYPSFPGVGLPPADDETPVGDKVRVQKHGWIEQLWDFGIQKLCDHYDFHPYINGHATSKLKMVARKPFDWRDSSRYGTFCDTLERRICQFRRLISPTLPIVDSESGFIDVVNAPWLFLPPLDRTDWYTREVSLAQSVRYSILKKAIGFKREYYFMFLGLNLERHGLDMVCKDLTPTAALPARAAFAHFLDGAEYVTRMRRNESTWHVVFTKAGKTVVAYWDASLENRPAGTISVGGVSGEWYDVMGNRIAPAVEMPLDATPRYFISDAPAGKVAAAFNASEIGGLKPVNLKLGLASDGRIVVSVSNVTKKRIEAATYRISVDGPASAPQTLSVDALGPQETLETFFRPEFREGGVISVTLTTPDGSISSNTLRFPSVRIKAGKPQSPTLSFAYDPDTKKVSPAHADGGGGHVPVKADFYFWVTPDALHLTADVMDGTFLPAIAPNDIFKGDVLEYFFDFNPEDTAESDVYTLQGFRLKVGPASPVRHEYDRNQSDISSLKNDFVRMGDVSSNVIRTEGGWRCETTLPLVRPLSSGHLFRFGVQVQNHDGASAARVNWTWGRVFKGVSRLGVAVVE